MDGVGERDGKVEGEEVGEMCGVAERGGDGVGSGGVFKRGEVGVGEGEVADCEGQGAVGDGVDGIDREEGFADAPALAGDIVEGLIVDGLAAGQVLGGFVYMFLCAGLGFAPGGYSLAPGFEVGAHIVYFGDDGLDLFPLGSDGSFHCGIGIIRSC